ncbi:MAG: PKD domain-containing protein, partial [Flavobacteriales bacterium]|nr:PKD domain-containing protein [Flavobacteriales bacterium]
FEPSYTFPDTGSYVVTLIVNPGETCADTISQLFTAYPEIAPDFDIPEPFCAGGGMAMDFEGGGVFGSGDEFVWVFDGPTSIDSEDSIDPSVIIYNEPGTYDVSFTITNDNCSETIIQSVDIPSFPVAAIQPQVAFCTGLDFDFVNASTGSSSYLWDFGVPGPDDFSNDENPSFSYPDFGEYNVTLIADPGSDCQDSTHLNLIVSPEDPVVIAYDFDPGDPCDSIPGVQATFIGFNVDEVTWDMGDATVYDEFEISHIYPNQGTYLVTITAYYELCDITKEDQFEVYYQTEAIDAPILMPNVFSPNDDIWNERLKPFFPGENEGLLPPGRTTFDYISEYKLQVYNRWGNLLYDSSDGINWWDGTINGERAEEGTYYFTVTYKEQCEAESKSYSGSVELLYR